MLDVQLFGLRPRWHHLTNLLFHLANTLLLFKVLHRLTKAHWESVFVAALFALHPLHVESVAWVSERKDVLSTFFWLLTMGAYCTYVERPGLRRYLVVVLFFVLGLMSKPMLVTLPFVLLLLDYWPLQRFRQSTEARAETRTGSRGRWESRYSLFWEKCPFLLLAALTSIVTYSVQHQGGAVVSLKSLSLGTRISNAIVAYSTYIGNTIWPSDLAFYYSLPLSLPALQVFGAVVLMTVVTITVIWNAGRTPYLAMGWLWYVGTLLPVIGIVQVGLQGRADRYTYVPLIGLFIIVGWGISELSKKWRYRKELLVASSMAVLVGLSMITRTQVRYWQNSIALFDHALNVTDNNYVAYKFRGTYYLSLGNNSQAISDYSRAIEINPKFAEAYFTRAIAYSRLGNRAREGEDIITAARLGFKDAQNICRPVFRGQDAHETSRPIDKPPLPP